MVPNKLIEAVVVFVFMAAAAGQLPRLIKTVQIAQYKLLKDSHASKWPKAMLFVTNSEIALKPRYWGFLFFPLQICSGE